MAKTQRFGHHVFFIFCLTGVVLLRPGSGDSTFTLVNKCAYTVWPGLLSGAGTSQLSTTGLTLDPGATARVTAPPTWSGRIWARTHCSTNATTGKFSCLTGDCASGTIQCSGAGAVPPATLAEFTLAGAGGLDFYDVSLVDGFNLPLVVVPSAAGNCSAAGCYVDLNGSCPAALRVAAGGGSVACRSACDAFGSPRYCCSGDFSTAGACRPSAYSEYFKSACPSAYSYAFDDASSTFTCAGADYAITFCPTPAATKRSTSPGQAQSPEGSTLIPSTTPFYFVNTGDDAGLTAIPIAFVFMSLLASVLSTFDLRF